ncbi:hypothetical protein WN944_012034 [Citrus x changshan-huyou]|uniref:Uncharacterized protein n=1 Tax=Citrus x changshan-huyou TaxID=2935761 RepID=A0AAP0R1W5_9ROSI
MRCSKLLPVDPLFESLSLLIYPSNIFYSPVEVIGIIKRKALIKELAALYHAECLAYCQELLELQKKWEEPFVETKPPDDSRKEITRLPKRLKKTR